jgi:thiol-disulfide isomerase/thioredoxin
MPPVDITNVNDLNELDKRLEAGPITLVFVYADWCGHCQKYKPNMEELEGMSNRSVQTVRIRDDVFPKSSINGAKIEGYPSLLLIKPRENAEENPKPVIFEQENGETTNVIPDHHNMQNMGAIVANAGTPAGLRILDKANINKKNIVNANKTSEDKEDVVAVNKSNGSLIKNISNSNNTKKNNKNNTNAIISGLPLATAEATPLATAIATADEITTPQIQVNTEPVEETESSNSANRSENTIVYTPLSVSPGTPPDIALNRRKANQLVAEEEHVEEASTTMSQQGQRGGGGLMDMLSKVAYQYGPAAALLIMANVKASGDKKTKKRKSKN